MAKQERRALHSASFCAGATESGALKTTFTTRAARSPAQIVRIAENDRCLVTAGRSQTMWQAAWSPSRRRAARPFTALNMLNAPGLGTLVSGGLLLVLIGVFGTGAKPPPANDIEANVSRQSAKRRGSGAERSASQQPAARVVDGRDACPCQSGKEYGACCKPYHRAVADGSVELAETAEGVLRARFSAFALGDVAYLVHSTSSSHEDWVDARADPDAFLFWKASIRSFCKRYGFVSIDLLNAKSYSLARRKAGIADTLAQAFDALLGRNLSEREREAELRDNKRLEKRVAKLLFRANLLEDGIPIAFIEESRFVREGPRWLYAGGKLISAPDLDLD